MKIVIPSKGRPLSVRMMTKLFPSALWCVDREDARAYGLCEARCLIHPRELIGLPRKRQWILDHVDDEVVFIVDDDIRFLFCNVGLVGRRIVDPEKILQVIENALEIARGYHTSLFGFAKHGDVRKYNPSRPLDLATWVGTAIGIIGRKFKFNPALTSRGDLDFSLQVLERDRCVVSDNRFAFVSSRFLNTGGSSTIRTGQTDEADMAWLKREWGRYINFTRTKQGLTPHIMVERSARIEV